MWRRRGNGPSRAKHKKSRKGCDTCKHRHIKCDETRPQCANCTKHKTRCPYNVIPVPTESVGSLVATQLPGGIYNGDMLDCNVGDEGNASTGVLRTCEAATSHVPLRQSCDPPSSLSLNLDAGTNRWPHFIPPIKFGCFPSSMPQSPRGTQSPLQQTAGLYPAAATHLLAEGLYLGKNFFSWYMDPVLKCEARQGIADGDVVGAASIVETHGEKAARMRALANADGHQNSLVSDKILQAFREQYRGGDSDILLEVEQYALELLRGVKIIRNVRAAMTPPAVEERG